MTDTKQQIINCAIDAKKAFIELAKASSTQKNNALKAASKAILKSEKEILEANKKDIEAAKANKISGAFLDRLILIMSALRQLHSLFMILQNLLTQLGVCLQLLNVQMVLKLIVFLCQLV